MFGQSQESLMALQKWLAEHPHLTELARLHEVIWANLDGQTQASVPATANKDALPVLHNHRLDAAFLTQAGKMLHQVLESLPAEGLSAQFSEQSSQLHEQLRQSPNKAAQMVESIVRANPCVRPDADGQGQEGLARFFVWKVLTSMLQPLREQLESRVVELNWQEAQCPLCGAGPAMAQIARSKKGSIRLLVCGCCESRWPYKRIGCPYCGTTEADQLAILELEDAPLRIDTCSHCQGFLKTYVGSGEEAIMLADWTTLHLDALAMQRGWRRRADSLYRL